MKMSEGQMTEDEILEAVDAIDVLQPRKQHRGLRCIHRRLGGELPDRAARGLHEDDGGRAISLLLLEISQVLLAGARLGAQIDFEPRSEYQPDVGPDADLDDMRLRLAKLLGGVDTYSFVFDPYVPELVDSQLSDDLTSIAADLENGLRHYRAGDLDEALWWWQFSYVSSWGTSPAPCSTRCSRSFPTTGSTSTSTSTPTRSPRRMRCWRRTPSSLVRLGGRRATARGAPYAPAPSMHGTRAHHQHEDRYPWA